MSPKGFFPISKVDAIILILLFIISMAIFLPWSRNVSIYGMVLFGWLMAGFMLIAPIISLLAFYLEKRRK